MRTLIRVKLTHQFGNVEMQVTLYSWWFHHFGWMLFCFFFVRFSPNLSLSLSIFLAKKTYESKSFNKVVSKHFYIRAQMFWMCSCHQTSEHTGSAKSLNLFMKLFRTVSRNDDKIESLVSFLLRKINTIATTTNELMMSRIFPSLSRICLSQILSNSLALFIAHCLLCKCQYL